MRIALLLALLSRCRRRPTPWRIGSKPLYESYILGEVLRQTVEGRHPSSIDPVWAHRHRFRGAQGRLVDLYPEYTGTIAKEILKLDGNPESRSDQPRSCTQGLGAAVRRPLGA